MYSSIRTVNTLLLRDTEMACNEQFLSRLLRH